MLQVPQVLQGPQELQGLQVLQVPQVLQGPQVLQVLKAAAEVPGQKAAMADRVLQVMTLGMGATGATGVMGAMGVADVKVAVTTMGADEVV